MTTAASVPSAPTKSKSFDPAVVKQNVMARLGTIPRFKEARCTHLYDNCFRINVFCWNENDKSEFIKGASIEHSYFVTASSDGCILAWDADRGSKPLD